MRHQIAAAAIVVVGLLALSGCAPAPATQSARNPFHDCRGQGLSAGSEAFDGCVERTIAQRCAGAERAAEERCTRRLRDTVLVTDMLDRQGWRLGFDQLRLN